MHVPAVWGSFEGFHFAVYNTERNGGIFADKRLVESQGG